MRTPLALTAAALLVLGLAGCSSATSSSVACDRLASPGNGTKAVTVTGDFGKKPDVKFASGLSVNQTESADVITGSGAVAVAGSSITIEAEIFNAKTGELLGAHMIGAEVTEMIQGFVVGKTLETTEAELMQTVFPHPTISESMHEAVLAAYGRALHI